MTLFDYVTEHPWWTLTYLSVMASGLAWRRTLTVSVVLRKEKDG